MIQKALILTAITAVMTSACEPEASEDKREPAVLSETSPSIRAEITQVVSKALGGRNVLIADNSLMTTDRLIIEQRNAVHNGMTVMTREDPLPDHFRLMMSGKSCMLVHEQTGEVYPLLEAICKAAPSKG